MNRSRHILGVFVTALAWSALASDADAKPVKILSFSFELPDSWQVDEDRDHSGKLFAAVPGGAAYEPPMLIALGCVNNRQGQCSLLKFPEKRENVVKEVCPEPIRQSIAHAGNMVETRWICLPEALKGKKNEILKAQKVASGVSWFDTTDGVLQIAYLAGPGDVPVDAFMADLARSVRYNSSRQFEGSAQDPH